jgi:hypothetical protein
MNSSMMTADRSTHRKVIALGAVMAIVTATIAMFGRSGAPLEALHRSPAVQRAIVSTPGQPLAMAELK